MTSFLKVLPALIIWLTGLASVTALTILSHGGGTLCAVAFLVLVATMVAIAIQS